MAAGNALQGALRSFANVERDIVALGQKADPEKIVELVNMRRDLVLEFAKLGAALTADPHLVASPDKMTEGTRLFAAFRTANSINQADWPVVRVRDNPEAYRGSSSHVGDRSRAFWQWVERELGYKR